MDSPRGAAGETPVGNQRARLAQPHRFQIRGWVKHFLHPRPAFRPFVADHHHVARHHFTAEDRFYRIILAFVHLGRAAEGEGFPCLHRRF